MKNVAETAGHRADRLVRREDFALREVPQEFRAPPLAGLFGVILGIPSALVFLAVGGALERTYGTMALCTALVVASLIIGYAGWVLTSFASRSGLDSDLMSIPAGFGLRGSAVTSAIYSANFVMLFAIEDSIIASSVHYRYAEVPKFIVLVVVAVLVLMLAWRGVSGMTSAMLLSLPVFLILMVIACEHATGGPSPGGSFWTYRPVASRFSTTGWLSALAVLLAFIVNATVAADVGRFLPAKKHRAGAVLFGGLLQVVSFGGATLLGAWLSWRLQGATNPGLYLPVLLGVWGLVCVVISQIRINLINAYSGSLSLSNFGARLLGVRAGRHMWMIGLVCAATLLAMSNIYEHLLGVLTFEAVFVMAWVGSLVSYIVLRHPEASRHSAGSLDRAPLLNPVGLSSLALGLAVATPLAFGAVGALGSALAPLCAFLVTPIGVAVGGLILGEGRKGITTEARPRLSQ